MGKTEREYQRCLAYIDATIDEIKVDLTSGQQKAADLAVIIAIIALVGVFSIPQFSMDDVPVIYSIAMSAFMVILILPPCGLILFVDYIRGEKRKKIYELCSLKRKIILGGKPNLKTIKSRVDKIYKFEKKKVKIEKT